MRRPAIAALATTLAAAPVRADATDHATGAMVEVRHSPNSDSADVGVAHDSVVVGYLDRLFSLGVLVGFLHLDSTFNGPAKASALTVGPTLRGVLAHSGDRATELVAEGTATITFVTDDQDSGNVHDTWRPLRFEGGVGVRHWLLPELAIGATIVLRYTRYTIPNIFPNAATTDTSLGGALYFVGVF